MSHTRKEFLQTAGQSVFGTGFAVALGPLLLPPAGEGAIQAPGAAAVTTPAWLNVRAFGAVGDGMTDDHAAIQKAIDAAQAAGPWSVVYVPTGRYALSDSLLFTKHGISIHCEGVLTPTANFTGYLVRLAGLNLTSDRKNDNWQAKIDITKLTIDGQYRSRGIWIERIDHSLISNVLIERTAHNGLHVWGVRESDFVNVTLAGCDGRDEPNVEISQSDGDGANSVQFFGITIVYCAGQMLKIDSTAKTPSRCLSFFGAQMHYLDRAKPWGSPNNDTKLIEILNANHVRFVSSNLRAGATSSCTLLTLGGAGREARDVGFIGTTLSGDGTGATGLNLVNCSKISFIGCDWRFERGRDIMGSGGSEVLRVDAGGYCLWPAARAPARPAPGTMAMADGVTWNPARKTTAGPYPVFFDGKRWSPLG